MKKSRPMTNDEIKLIFLRLLPRVVIVNECKIVRIDREVDGVKYDRELSLAYYTKGFANDAKKVSTGLKVGVKNDEVIKVITDFVWHVLTNAMCKITIPFLKVEKNETRYF